MSGCLQKYRDNSKIELDPLDKATKKMIPRKGINVSEMPDI